MMTKIQVKITCIHTNYFQSWRRLQAKRANLAQRDDSCYTSQSKTLFQHFPKDPIELTHHEFASIASIQVF
jgi:hypothetical protein